MYTKPNLTLISAGSGGRTLSEDGAALPGVAAGGTSGNVETGTENCLLWQNYDHFNGQLFPSTDYPSTDDPSTNDPATDEVFNRGSESYEDQVEWTEPLNETEGNLSGTLNEDLEEPDGEDGSVAAAAEGSAEAGVHGEGSDLPPSDSSEETKGPSNQATDYLLDYDSEEFD